ncbi:MAG TPA: hypothetical protein VGL03_09500 [Thermoanaerobaculia bacterium]|jgi:hypothetical protein
MPRNRLAILLSLLILLALFPAFPSWAQTGPDPREHSFQFFVDGVLTGGIVGYRIEFNHNPVVRTDSRRLDTAYSPDQRRLVMTVTQKGLNRLQDWLNGATDTGTPVSKSVALVARDNQENVLARWELAGVIPATFSSAGAGMLTEVDATVEFTFETLRLVQAAPN